MKPRVRVHESRYGRELIVDETFASFYRPGEVATGSVWDAIAAPLLAVEPRKRRRILVLGLGAGSAARIARALAPQAEIVGVELDGEVIAAARESFELDALGLEIHLEDALAFLQRERRLFDAIFEDVFLGHGDDVRKPPWIPTPGHDLARKRLAKGGVLVTNTLDEYARVARSMKQRLPNRLVISVEGYDNRILAASESPLDARQLRDAVAAEASLAPTLPNLRFRSLR